MIPDRAGVGLLIEVLCVGIADAQVPFTVQSGLFNQANTNTLGLSQAPGTETFSIFEPTASTDHFSNGAAMIGFKGHLYCQWQSSPTDEDSPDTWVAYSRSSNGMTWETPMVLAANPGDGYRSSGGWWVNGETLVAFINHWPASVSPRGGYTEYTTSTNGMDWTPIQRVTMSDGDYLNGIFEQDPHALPGGRIINAAHFQPGLTVSPIYTDDPSGVSGWVRPAFTNLNHSGDVTRELEPSWFYRSDGAVVMIFRDQNSTYLKLASVSTNSGQSWTLPVLTAMPDSRAKQSAGNLPDGTAYMVNNPRTNNTRIPLALTLGKTGSHFDKAYVLRPGGSDLQPRRYPGNAKTLGYSYPKTTLWNGYLYVGYVVNKEDVQCTRVPLTALGNTAPTLAAISNRIINPGANLSITNVAMDVDVPAQTLTYKLVAAVTNAVLGTNSGVFTWRPLVTQANTTNAFSVIVTDNGSPSLSATQNFSVIVNALVRPSMTSPVKTGNQIGFTVNGQVGPDYTIEASTNLVDWISLGVTNPIAMPFQWSVTNAGDLRFHRIKAGPP